MIMMMMMMMSTSTHGNVNHNNYHHHHHDDDVWKPWGGTCYQSIPPAGITACAKDSSTARPSAYPPNSYFSHYYYIYYYIYYYYYYYYYYHYLLLPTLILGKRHSRFSTPPEITILSGETRRTSEAQRPAKG